MCSLNDARLRPLHTQLAQVRHLVPPVALGVVLYFAADVPLVPVVILLVAGEFLQLWAAANLQKISGCPADNPAFTLVQSGPYAFVRNPMYIGRFIVGLGLSLIPSFRWFVLPVFVVVYVAYAQARVLREEPRIADVIGEEYTEYCRRVNRWLPRWPARRNAWLIWSWANVRLNHQLRFSAGLALTVILVILRAHLA